jgi:tetratricopeptide (TPR) repeat protein
MLNLGLKELPASRKLLALRSEAHLALAERVGGKLVPTDTHAEQARRDADMALPDGDSSGPYAAGRVAEEDGNLEAAETHFRQALALQPADLRYQASLARVLLSSELSRRTGANPSSGSYDSSEATRLVEAVIAGGQPEGLLLRSRLLALRGEWTQGLREFATGLSESGRVPSGYATDLTRLVSNHPILQRPASAERPDRRRAELSYYEGVSLYVGGAYAEAERAFSEAVRYGSLDARYWYYLGASQFQLGKLHLADDCFRQAAQREQVNLPEASELAEALERLQGAPRQAMRRYHR